MLRVMDAPGYCTRPSSGRASAEEGGDRNAQQRHWRTRSIFPSLSPPHLPTPGRSFGHGGDIVRAVHRGPPPGASGEGGSSLHETRANFGQASNTKGPLRRKRCTPKTAMTPVVATIRLRRSSPRSRGPPSQSESYVWDKALICRRSGESNSSI